LTRLEALDKFVKSYLENVALPNPSAKSDNDRFLLPLAFTLKNLHTDYCHKFKTSVSEGELSVSDKKSDKPLSWGKFYERWKEKFSNYARTWGKRSGCCEFCSIKKQEIRDAKTDIARVEQLQIELNTHLKLAEDARQTYNEHRIKTAKIDGKVVLSIDFAENIMVPSLTETPATFYFKTRRKIDVFGICNEEITENGSVQLNYLIDEPHKISKDPNSVISMLDHYLMNFVPPETKIIIYADNCCSHNKNQFLIRYLCYITKILN